MAPSAVAKGLARRRSFAALVALSLTAAACGGTDSSSTPTLATQAPPAEAEPAAESAEPEAPEPDEAVAAAPSDEVTEEEPVVVEEEATPAVNLFPDIDVLNIADGSTVNLAAELGGADQATLLWFFAPH